MRWKIRSDQYTANLIVNNCPVFHVKREDAIQAFDELLKIIDRLLVKTDSNGNEFHKQYVHSIITINITCENLSFRIYERHVMEYIEIDDYIRAAASVFDVLNAHHYRKL